MTFTVKYRAGDGAMREECIEASTRSECIAKCRTRGIAPISVRDGSISNAKSQRRGSRRAHSGLLWLAVVIIAAIGGIVWWSKESQKLVFSEPKYKSNKTTSTIVTTSKTGKGTPIKGETNRLNKIYLDVDNVVPQERSAIETETEQIATNNIGPLQKQIFKSGTEQVISWIFMCPVGSMPPILPTLPESELSRIEEILNSENLISEFDEWRIAEAKETVDYVKKELKQFLSEGGKVEDFLKHYHSMLVKAHRTREESRKIVEEVELTNPEIAESFKKKVNARLREDGVLELETDTTTSEETEK